MPVSRRRAHRQFRDAGPVSYTHLDVYKRQFESCEEGIRRIGEHAALRRNRSLAVLYRSRPDCRSCALHEGLRLLGVIWRLPLCTSLAAVHLSSGPLSAPIQEVPWFFRLRFAGQEPKRRRKGRVLF